MRIVLSLLLGVTSLFLIACGGSTSPAPVVNPTPVDPPVPPTPPNPPGTGELSQINHIIWTLQEFHSFDSYFVKLNDYRVANGLPADVDGLPADASNPSYDGSTQVPAFHLKTVCVELLSPAWNESRRDVNRNHPGSKDAFMDGFVYAAAHYAIDRSAAGFQYYDVLGLRTMGYYTEREIPYYYFMANQFAISDRFFGTILSRTPPNRIANIAGSPLGVSNSPPDGAFYTQKTIFHLLEEAGISWKIYADEGTYLGYFQPFISQHSDHVVPIAQYFTDLGNGSLPQVVYIEPQNATNEHTGTNNQKGAAHIADLMNALMKSSAWKESVFFLSYDHGGLYDHVPPQPAVLPDNIPPQLDVNQTVDDYSRTGFRVPLLVVSPFTKEGYVSHTVMDQTAVLKFIETRFSLPSLTARDAAQPPMLEFFDLTNVPNLKAPTPPVQPTDGPCTFAKLQ
jgi:phospholipase C